MANITNNYAQGSCVFEAGSSQNGDITITGPIYQGKADSAEDASANEANLTDSPLYLSNKKGTKIDFIRVMNAWYECGKVTDASGNRLTKRDYFLWLGRVFNIDLADYDKDLSNSMSSSVAYEKQTRIFDELKERHQDIYNSK